VQAGSAKIWVYIDGTTEIVNPGHVSKNDLSTICKYIEKHYIELFFLWEKTFGKLEIKDEPGLLFTALDIQQQQQQQHIQTSSQFAPKESGSI